MGPPGPKIGGDPHACDTGSPGRSPPLRNRVGRADILRCHAAFRPQIIRQDIHGSRRRLGMDCSPKRSTAHRPLPGRLRSGWPASLLTVRRQPTSIDRRVQGARRSLSHWEMRGPDHVPHFPRGIELDTVAWSLRLPADKLSRIKATLQEWSDRIKGLPQERARISCRPASARLQGREAGPLIPSAHDKPASWPVRLERSPPIVRLNREFRADLLWWSTFVSEWNGIALMPKPSDERIQFSTDAAGSWGCGASWKHHWFQLPWDAQSLPLSISVKEMLPIIMAAAVWGEQWRGRQATCFCDNQAVVAVLSSRSCREDHLMHMLRCLFYIEAYHGFSLRCVHVPGAIV